jgi:hypothetical protein
MTYKAISFTDVATIQIDRFKFSTDCDGQIDLTLIHEDDPGQLARGPKSNRPWSLDAIIFRAIPGAYKISGDTDADTTAPVCTVVINSEAYIVLDGLDIYFVAVPGSFNLR